MMLRHYGILSVGAALIVSGAGCSNITMLRTQELRAVQQHVDSLRTDLMALQKTMYEEQKTQTEIVRLIRADQQLRFGELDRKVSEITSNLSENQFRLSKIDEQTADFRKKLEAKLISDSMSQNSRTAEIEKLFQIAMSDFNAGRYGIAINGFKDLFSQFPDSPLAAEAEYWVAECNYAKRAYNAAEVDYIAYVKKYPQGAKFCVALYKLGLAYEKQNKAKSKTMVWKKALEQCPDSPEIQVIRAQMK
ncbi:MAG: outer membrane protein assembly factor BamD [Chitinispirillaceae bacterium]|nr:outer membrane protein assembly factor BamD [Chitinispirillaceae bacterium]